MSESLLALGRLWAVSLYEASFEISILILLVTVAGFVLRRSSPAVRYGLWCIVLVRLCLPFELNLHRLVGLSEVRSPNFASWFSSGGEETSSRRARWEKISRTRQNLTVTSIGWGVTFLSLAGFVAFRAVQLRRRISRLPVMRTSELEALVNECRAEMGLRRRVEVRYAPDQEGGVPAVTSLFVPVIILPQTMVTSWEARDLKPILMHELAHVRRADVLVNWLQIILQCVYFFHPLVWFANWKIRALREEACDDLSVAHLGGRPSRYSQSLLRAVELAQASPAMCGAIGLHERKSDLGKRLRRLLTEGYRPGCERRVLSACKIVVVGGLCLLVSGVVPAQTPLGPPQVLKRAATGIYGCKGKKPSGNYRKKCDGRTTSANRKCNWGERTKRQTCKDS